jgi:hypothetical protein
VIRIEPNELFPAGIELITNVEYLERLPDAAIGPTITFAN